MIKLKREIFNDTYLPYLTDYTHKFEVYFGGAGSGKSHFIASKILFRACRETRRVLVIRKTLVSQKDSCWSLFIALINQWKLNEFVTIQKSDYQLQLNNGSTIIFKGLDDPERVKSIVGITDIWCEECTELTEDDFNQLILRVRARTKQNQIFCSFNPISKASWVYKRWFSGENHDNAFILKTTYKDNKFLTDDYVSSIENMVKVNPTYYKIYALGEFTSLEKLVYNNWVQEDFDYRTIDGELVIGLDYGFTNDPTALVASIVKENDMYIFREWVATGKTNPEIAQAITSLGFSKSFIIADSAEPKSVEEIRRLGITRIRESKKGADSIIHGIQTLQQYKIHVSSECPEVITELQNYSWSKDTKTNEYINKPIDMFNHCLDALRYSIQALDKHKLRAVDKEIFGI